MISDCGGLLRSCGAVATILIRLFHCLACVATLARTWIVTRNSAAALFLFLPALTSSLCAHPFHLCVGQMKWNADVKVWEVSLRLHPQDLEKAMSEGLQKKERAQPVSIDDDGFSKLATRYLSSHFYVRRSPLAMNSEEFTAILRSSKTLSWTSSASDRTTKGASDQDQSSLKWIGMEQERGWLWIHLELRQPSFQPERQKLWIINRILLDSVERQENTIAIDPVSTRKFSLQFRSGEEFQEMKPK